MKKWTGLSTLLALLAMFAGPSAFAIKEVGNGGDPLALEFKLALYRAIDDLKDQNIHVNLQSLNEEARSVRVLVVDEPLNVPFAESNQSSAAENIESQNLIKVNRAAWTAIQNPIVKQALALHEVLSLMGVESTAQYSLSQDYLNEKSGLHLSKDTLSSVKVATSCAEPKGNAAELFGILADPLTTPAAVETYLSGHPVAVDALNQRCQTPMMFALKSQREDLFKLLFSFSPSVDVNAIQSRALAKPDRRTLFYYIVSYGSWDLIQEFKAKGANLEPFLREEFDLNTTEFMIAAGTNSVDVINKYLARGAQLNLATKVHHLTPLMLASENNSPEAVGALIAAGANFQAKTSNGSTALMLAAAHSITMDTLRRLVKAGADVNERDGEGFPTLFYAVTPDPTSAIAIKTLISLGADLEGTSKQQTRALMIAAYKNDEFAVRALLDLRAQVNATNETLATALTYAAGSENDTSKVIKELISAGANANAVDTNGQSPIFFVPGKHPENELAKFKALVDGGADVNHVDNQGATALIYAAQSSSDETVAYLVNVAGADRNIISKNNSSAWSVAKAMRRSSRVIQLLYSEAVKDSGQALPQASLPASNSSAHPSAKRKPSPVKPLPRKPVRRSRRPAPSQGSYSSGQPTGILGPRPSPSDPCCCN